MPTSFAKRVYSRIRPCYNYSMLDINKYPNLKEAIIEIAYDNGLVRRGVTEEQLLAGIWPKINYNHTDGQIGTAELQLASMDSDFLDEFLCGEYDEEDHELYGAADTILTYAFENM